MAPTMYDTEEVKLALRARPRAVLERYGKVHRSGGQYECSWCPGKAHGRRAMTFHPIKLVWCCHVCNTGGDVFDLIAGAEGLGRGDFGKVIAIAAEIAGVPPTTASHDERVRLHAEWKRQNAAAAAAEAEREAKMRRSANARSIAYWEGLQPHHVDGIRYLDQRGLAVAHESGLLRYDGRHGGAPSLALLAFDGDISNVVRRPIGTGEKPRGLPECGTSGTFVHSVKDIETDRDVILAEGFADSLTALVAWKDARVLGAHGAGNLPTIAKEAATRIAAVGGRMVVVPHRDEAGFVRSREVVALALRAGLSLHRGTLRVVHLGAKDLNDAWCNGWRPAA